MIKKLINKILPKKIKEEDIECAIDENIVDCKEIDDPYVGVPAPILNPLDEWFGSSYGCPPAITEKQKDYMERETESKMEEALNSNSKEPDNIHQLMYEMATKSGATTLQLDPIGGSENFQGGSENVHR
jgi:hypothetical protein|tara:strand:+ start:798 stop:1184 length:387 start_codon:yes stop_codon:yes gene_type:complete